MQKFILMKPMLNPTADSGPLIFYGAGVVCRNALTYCSTHMGLRPRFICDMDNLKVGTRINGVEVISFDTLLSMDRKAIIVITPGAPDVRKEIQESLVAAGFHNVYAWGLADVMDQLFYGRLAEFGKAIEQNKEEIEKLSPLLADDHSREVLWSLIDIRKSGEVNGFKRIYSPDTYFPADLFKLSTREVFVDGGASIGDTVELFRQKTQGEYYHIYAFEPFEENRERFSLNVEDDGRVTLLPYGLYDENGLKRFNTGINTNSGHVDEKAGDTVIECRRLDDMNLAHAPTFIKLDIDGAERKAISGMASLIRIHKPKLAACLYHLADDLWHIPLLFHELCGDYHLYLRHHSEIHYHETILYALPKVIP